MVPYHVFALTLGVYLFPTILVITYFILDRKKDDDAGDLRCQFGRT